MRVVYGIIDPKTGEPPRDLPAGKHPTILTAVTLVVPEDNTEKPYIVQVFELADESNMPADEDKEGPSSNGNVGH